VNTGIGLLSKRVKKIPSTEVDQDRYTFLSLQDSEPDLGVPAQNGNFLVSTTAGNRAWTTNILFDNDAETLELHQSHALRGTTETTQTQSATVILKFSSIKYGSAKLLIQVYDTVSNQRQISELLVIHDDSGSSGERVSATEYAVLFTGAEPLATFDVDANDDDILVLSIPNSENLLEYKVSETLMLA
jgi:hypothetical protein